MPQRWLATDEWYPVLLLRRAEDGYSGTADAREFSDDELADIRRLQSEFNAWQKKISERFDCKPMQFGDREIEVAI